MQFTRGGGQGRQIPCEPALAAGGAGRMGPPRQYGASTAPIASSLAHQRSLRRAAVVEGSVKRLQRSVSARSPAAPQGAPCGPWGSDPGPRKGWGVIGGAGEPPAGTADKLASFLQAVTLRRPRPDGKHAQAQLQVCADWTGQGCSCSCRCRCHRRRRRRRRRRRHLWGNPSAAPGTRALSLCNRPNRAGTPS